MATILYRNARLLIGDSDLSVQLTDLSVDYSAEVLDATTFGADTRIHAGGLLMAHIAGKGFFDPVSGTLGIESVLFNDVGVDDVVLTVFANGITEGTTSDMGFSCKAVVSDFKIGSTVGTLLPIEFAADSRGLV